MKGLLLTSLNPVKLSVSEIEKPVPGLDEILIKIKAAAICGTDLHCLQGDSTVGSSLPVLLGHEYSGIVEQIGDAVSGFKIGDRVTGETTAYVCGECTLCRSGWYNLCAERKIIGYASHGAFTSYIVAPKQFVHHVPDEVSFEEAALTEPVCVAYHAVIVRSSLRAGQKVVIFGPGPIGLACILMARMKGASEIVSVGIQGDEDRLKVAGTIGADRIIALSGDSAKDWVEAIGLSGHVDTVVDAAGPNSIVEAAFQLLKPGGEIIKLAWDLNSLAFSISPLVIRAYRIQGVFSHTWPMWEAVLSMMGSKKIDLEPLVTHTFPLSRWQDAFDILIQKKGIGVILTPED